MDFTVDLSQSQAARQKIDWNSKRAGKVISLVPGGLIIDRTDDEDIETGIRLRFSRTPVADPGGNRNRCYESPVIEFDANTLGQEVHGTTLDGKEAACTLKTEIGLINCSTCINAVFAIFSSSLIQSDRELARRIFDCVRSQKETGLSKVACLVCP